MAGGSANAAAARVACADLWAHRHQPRRTAGAGRRARRRRAVLPAGLDRAGTRPRRRPRARAEPRWLPLGAGAARRRAVHAGGVPPVRRAQPGRRSLRPPPVPPGLLEGLACGDVRRVAGPTSSTTSSRPPCRCARTWPSCWTPASRPGRWPASCPGRGRPARSWPRTRTPPSGCPGTLRRAGLWRHGAAGVRAPCPGPASSPTRGCAAHTAVTSPTLSCGPWRCSTRTHRAAPGTK